VANASQPGAQANRYSIHARYIGIEVFISIVEMFAWRTDPIAWVVEEIKRKGKASQCKEK